MRNNRSRLATWMDVTDDAAPTTPDITFRTCVLLQWYSPPSMLLIEPDLTFHRNWVDGRQGKGGEYSRFLNWRDEYVSRQKRKREAG